MSLFMHVLLKNYTDPYNYKNTTIKLSWNPKKCSCNSEESKKQNRGLETGSMQKMNNKI